MEEKKKKKTSATEVVKEIKRRTKRIFSPEEKIRIVLEGLRGEDSIAAICRKYDLHINTYYSWSKEFMCKLPTFSVHSKLEFSSIHCL